MIINNVFREVLNAPLIDGRSGEVNVLKQFYMSEFMYGSICLSDVPQDLFKKVNGKVYLNISVGKKKETDEYGRTHWVSCSPKKDEQKDGVNYFIGNLTQWQDSPRKQPTAEEIAQAPSVTNDDLPF